MGIRLIMYIALYAFTHIFVLWVMTDIRKKQLRKSDNTELENKKLLGLYTDSHQLISFIVAALLTLIVYLKYG